MYVLQEKKSRMIYLVDGSKETGGFAPCVRNATSHAQFVYDWAPVNETIVFVLE